MPPCAHRKTLLSSPPDALPPETGAPACTQVVRRMLKRSRRVALAEQLEDKATEKMREHLAKRVKHHQDRVSNVGPLFDMAPTLQTPSRPLHPMHVSVVADRLVPELSPVPIVKRVVSGTGSRKLKENSTRRVQTLASPFSSRPGSAASSPKHKDRGRSSRRVLRNFLHSKSRTVSAVSRGDIRQVSQKNSTVSLKGTNGEPHPTHTQHHHHPSSQFEQEGWLASSGTLSGTLGSAPLSSGGPDWPGLLPSPIHNDISFYAGQPQFCSTPAMSRSTKALDLSRHEIVANANFVPGSPDAGKHTGKTFVGERLFDLPGSSPAPGNALFVHTCRKFGVVSGHTTAPGPSSPASDLAQELESMDICGGLDTHSDGEPPRSPAPTYSLIRAHSLQDSLMNAETTTKKLPSKRMPARNRAGTIRASDFVKPGSSVSSLAGAPERMVPSLSNVRRTRSGTVVGPESKLATKGIGTKTASLTAVQSGSEGESDDELQLKEAWKEDMVYLGLAMPADRGVEADELNLGGPWPPRRLWPKRRVER